MTDGREKIDGGEEPTAGGEPGDPTAVEGPIAEDDTSPEGIPIDQEATGVEAEDFERAAESDAGTVAAVDDDAPAGRGRDHAPPGLGGAPEPSEPDPPPQVRLLHSPPAQWQWRVVRIVAALALAGIAFGVHMWLNVPDQPVVAAPRDQGKKDAARPDRGNRSEPMPPRSTEELENAWSQWSGVPFDEEPARGRWARDMQNMVNKAVVVSRKAAFAGAPEEPRVIVTGTQCRTIRCRFVLRSPFEHELDMITRALERVTYEGEPMWREVDAERIDPPTPQSPKDDFYRQVIVGVHADVYEPAGLDVSEEQPE